MIIITLRKVTKHIYSQRGWAGGGKEPIGKVKKIRS
jgi:hypothetical protein